MLGRLWTAVTRWFRSGPESTVAAGNAQTPQQPPVKEDKYSHPEPAVEKLLEKTAAAKGTQVEASLASRNAELQKLPAKLDEQEKPAPAAEKLLEDTAAANRKEAEASVSNKATATAPTAELQKSPAEVAKVDTQEKPVSSAEKLLEDRATAKRKEVEASVSTKASAPPTELEKSPAKVSKADTQEKPVPSAEKLLESRATAKRKEVEASVFAKASAPTAELQRSPAKVTKVDKQEKPAPAAEKLLEDTAAAKRKEVEASVSTKASASTAELKKSPAKVSKVDQEKSVPSAEKLLADRAAAKRKQVEASLSFKASAESVANLPSGEPCNLAKGTGATGIAQASIVSEASSSTLPRRLEELKQTLKDKQEKLAVSASIDGDRSGRRSSFLPQADATEERPLNIFGVGEGFEDVPPRKRRVVLKPPPKVHSRDWASDQSDQSDQSVSEHSSELRDWRLLDQPIQTELDSPAGEAKAKASKKRKRGKKKKKAEAEEAEEAHDEKPQSELEKDIKGQPGRPSQVEAGRTVEQEGEDETPTKRAKKRKKRKKDKDHKESHKEAKAMQVEQPIHADLEKGDDGSSEEQNGIMSVSSGSGEDQDYGVVECKFVAENDAALGLRRRIQRHKTRALEEARKEEKKARKKAGKAAEKALKALRKAEKAEAKAEGFGFKKTKMQLAAPKKRSGQLCENCLRLVDVFRMTETSNCHCSM